MDSATFDDELLEFALEQPPAARSTLPPWRILIVDDNVEVHNATEISLRDVHYMGREFEFIHAFSAQQGSTILRHEQDIALVLLDVVMETHDAGLRLARHVREDLADHNVQIILRTGQPGEAPERRVIVDYEINDYKSKNELTSTQLFTAIISGLRAYETLQGKEKQFEALSSSLARVKDLERALDEHALVAITDPRGRILEANAKLCAVSKFAREDLIGQDIHIFNSGEHGDSYFRELWLTVSDGNVWKGEMANCGKDGERYWTDATIVPFRNPAGKIYQYISIGTDISARKRSEQALRDNDVRWKFAFDITGDGVWDMNFDTGIVSFSDRWKLMYGYAVDMPELRLDGWRQQIHPDDLAGVENSMRAYLAGESQSFSSEHRCLCKDGSWKWVLDRGLVVKRSDTGKPVRMVGTHTDISASRTD